MTQFSIELTVLILVLMTIATGIIEIVAIAKYIKCQKMLREELLSEYESIYPKKESDSIDENISDDDESETDRDHRTTISEERQDS